MDWRGKNDWYNVQVWVVVWALALTGSNITEKMRGVADGLQWLSTVDWRGKNGIMCRCGWLYGRCRGWKGHNRHDIRRR